MVVLGLNIALARHIIVFTVRGQKAHTQDDWMDLEPLTTKSVSGGDLSRCVNKFKSFWKLLYGERF